jgi:hypothetical protein
MTHHYTGNAKKIGTNEVAWMVAGSILWIWNPNVHWVVNRAQQNSNSNRDRVYLPSDIWRNSIRNHRKLSVNVMGVPNVWARFDGSSKRVGQL